MRELDLKERLKAQADDLRRQAEPIWASVDGPERDRDRRAFESSLDHFEQQRLCITVMGEFNTGKSTLLNTFIGDEILWVDQLESTAVPTWVRWTDDDRFDENRQAVVVRTDGESIPMPLSEVGVHTTLDRDSWKATERVEITLPCDDDERHPTGIVLVDTPGLNGSSELEARSMHQLGMSHAVVVVVPFDGVGRQTDAALIRKALALADDVMVVINKCDLLANSGDELERLRDALAGRIAGLDHERIYTISAKRQFEGAAYPDGERQLADQFNDFQQHLVTTLQSALKPTHSVLKAPPATVLRTICETEIKRIDELDAHHGAEDTERIDMAQSALDAAVADLERSGTEILDIARKTTVEVCTSVKQFLDHVHPRVEAEMRDFVDAMPAATVTEGDLDSARERLSDWLRTHCQLLIHDRVSSLFDATARRLMFDLEERVAQPGSRLHLPDTALDRLSTKDLKQKARIADEALSGLEDTVRALERRVADCRKELQARQDRLDEIDAHCTALNDLCEQRKRAVAKRERLGPKPAPKIEHYTGYETREMKRRGLSRILDLFSTKTEMVAVRRQRKDYSNVREWEQNFRIAKSCVAALDARIAPLRSVPNERGKTRLDLRRAEQDMTSAQTRLREEERRLASERDRYRQSGLQTRRALLCKGARHTLVTFFKELPRALDHEATRMYKRTLREFQKHFREVVKQEKKRLADERERLLQAARDADPGWERRRHSRCVLEKALRDLADRDTTVRP